MTQPTPGTKDAQSTAYVVGGILLFLGGAALAYFGPTSSVTYRTVEGISVFAVLYLISQSVERVTEWVVDLLSLVSSSPQQRKEAGLAKIRAADSTLNGNPTIADFGVQLAGGGEGVAAAVSTAVEATSAATADKEDGEEEVAQARRDITFLAHGASVLLCASAVCALNYSLLDQVGAKDVNDGVDRLVTVLAAAGGTKALHELIGRMQKAKEAAEKDSAGK